MPSFLLPRALSPDLTLFPALGSSPVAGLYLPSLLPLDLRGLCSVLGGLAGGRMAMGIAVCTRAHLLKYCGVGHLLDFALQVAGRGVWELHPWSGSVSSSAPCWDQNESGSPWILRSAICGPLFSSPRPTLQSDLPHTPL